jgi:hypothetical protein
MPVGVEEQADEGRVEAPERVSVKIGFTYSGQEPSTLWAGTSRKPV